MTYTLTVDAPRWARSRPLAWLARVLRADRRWAAHGRSQSGVWQALGRPSKVWTVTCPDGSTYRATYASPTEGMLKIQDQVGRVMVLPGTCKAVQE